MKALCTKARLWALGSAVALGLWGSPQAFAADEPDPTITVKTSYYEWAGADNIFTICIDVNEPIYIDVDCGFGLVEYEVEPSQAGTWIPCVVTADGVVKMYTDKPEVINYFYCQGGHITDIDLSQLTSLQVLDLSNNNLKKIDLSHNNKLEYLDLGTNTFEEEPLNIGKKPILKALEIEGVGNISPEFNLSDYPELVSFAAFSTYSLDKIDPTGCPKLQRISISVTGVSSIDVSKNPELRILDVSDTYVTSIDLSHNPKLEQFYGGHDGSYASDYKFTSLDISNNPNLVYLFMGSNALTKLDISNNPQLFDLRLWKNYLEEFDYSNNSKLYNVDISYNCLDFATLPINPPFSGEYHYEQRAMSVASSFAVGTTLDLSSRVVRDDIPADMRLIGISQSNITEKIVLSEDYYEYNDGRIKFKKEYPDSVYAEFTNSVFPECVLSTTKFMVKTQEQYGVPVETLSFAPVAGVGESLSFGIGANGASEATPRTLYVDFGDGVQVPVQVSCQVPDKANVVGTRTGTGQVKVYVNDGEGLTGLSIDGCPLYSIDLDKAPLLRSLSLTGTDLSYIDLKWQRCLQNLTLTGNRFGTLDLTTDILGYDKNVLSDVNVSDNQLTELIYIAGNVVKHLNVSHNSLTEIIIEKAYNMLSLDASYNEFTELATGNLDSLETLNIAGNHFTNVKKPWQETLKNFDCRENDMTFDLLPYFPGELSGEYLYAPQNQILISDKGPGFDVSEVGLEVDGVATQFVVRKEDGTILTAGVDYEINDGVVSFLNYSLGKVYCEMTNAKYPDLTISTSMILPAEAPTNVIGWIDVANEIDPDTIAYISVAATHDGASIYIDWNGDGTDFTEYSLKSTYTIFPVTPVAGRRAVIYSYGEPDFLNVFSITNVPMVKADFSPMKYLTDFCVMNAGNPGIVMPDTDLLESLTLDGNGITSIDPTRLKNLRVLAANQNNIKSIDLSAFPALEIVGLALNGMNEIKIDNPRVWNLDLMGNEFEHFSLAGLPALHQVRLSYNHLSSIDINGPELMRVLRLENNNFDFSTLPLVPETVTTYVYSNQAPVKAVVDGMTVDLSSQAMPHGVATTFYWCYDEPYYDGEGSLYAEFLEPNVDYTINNGVTTFNKEFANICCIMINELFPSTFLLTDLLTISSEGVEVATISAAAITVNDRTLTISADDNRQYGVFTVDGKTVATGSLSDGHAEIQLPSGGVYIVKAGNSSCRVMVK